MLYDDHCNTREVEVDNNMMEGIHKVEDTQADEDMAQDGTDSLDAEVAVRHTDDDNVMEIHGILAGNKIDQEVVAVRIQTDAAMATTMLAWEPNGFWIPKIRRIT
jgi:hypothetical protein